MPILKEKPRGMPESVWKHVRNLGDEKTEVRRDAAKALGKIGHPGAIPFLAEAVRDKEPAVKQYAVWSLNKIGHPDTIPPLAEALKEKDFGARTDAILALAKFGTRLAGTNMRGSEADAIRLVARHVRKNEDVKIVLLAYYEALKGKVSEENARLYVKQLRALQGRLK